ncbi:hypothetical protein OWV82_022821 [Melia azedarach]|uniref:Uncharacterized protein n=1 Tax=Melia azedarach TaxID=155640 RepID=A0ACC1WV29_MELAZ|nr:hypothetical protein OWV82_022821 [Melia azedarach]
MAISLTVLKQNPVSFSKPKQNFNGVKSPVSGVELKSFINYSTPKLQQSWYRRESPLAVSYGMVGGNWFPPSQSSTTTSGNSLTWHEWLQKVRVTAEECGLGLSLMCLDSTFIWDRLPSLWNRTKVIKLQLKVQVQEDAKEYFYQLTNMETEKLEIMKQRREGHSESSVTSKAANQSQMEFMVVTIIVAGKGIFFQPEMLSITDRCDVENSLKEIQHTTTFGSKCILEWYPVT